MQGNHYHFCTAVERADGYGYAWIRPTTQEGGSGTFPRP